jgi:hypothetical protein
MGDWRLLLRPRNKGDSATSPQSPWNLVAFKIQFRIDTPVNSKREKEKMTQPELDHIEQLVDVHTLRVLVDALVDICHAKAEHLQSNWQDKVAARSWERDAKMLARLSPEN